MTAVGGGRASGPSIDDDTTAAAPAPPARSSRRRWERVRLVTGAALVAVVGGVIGALTVLLVRAPAPPAATPAPAPTTAVSFREAIDAVVPAVMRIQVGEPETGTAGTAVVLTPSGDVVTNEHLVQGESTATLIDAAGNRSVARVVASDPAADLAWLRIDGAADLPVARLAGPDAVRLGDEVVAIGNALNLDGVPSITRGVVSAVGRSTAMLDDVIQTDAPISSGSSGGPLVDRTGMVVGITTEALVGDPTVSVEDIAFAIPADRVSTVLAGMGLVVPPAG
jgi:putative serine protease PepD